MIVERLFIFLLINYVQLCSMISSKTYINEFVNEFFFLFLLLLLRTYTVCPNKSDNTKLLALVSANLHRIAHN